MEICYFDSFLKKSVAYDGPVGGFGLSRALVLMKLNTQDMETWDNVSANQQIEQHTIEDNS
jgi:hypothetical protein